jgi:hypothetical protein
MTNINENITILLIAANKILKNKFIESLNLNNSQNHFTLMNKTIESLKSSSERIIVPCLICDYSIEPEANLNETNYVQLVDATEKSLINNLISRSINRDLNKNFQFYINAIIYLYDETSPETFFYIQSIHNEIKKTFNEFITNDDLLFLISNLINASTIGQSNKSSQENSAKLITLLDKFLNEFNNIQYSSQVFEDSVFGAKPLVDNDNETKIKASFDTLIARNISKIKLGLNKNKFNNKKISKDIPDVPSLNIRSETESMKSADPNLSLKTDKKISLSKKIYQGEMQHNKRNGNLN